MMFSLIKDIIIHPKKAFVQITENEDEYFGIALVILGISVVMGLLEFDNMSNILVSDAEIKTSGFYFYTIISTSLGTLLTAWLILKISRKLHRTQSNFRRVFSATQFSIIPSLLIGTPVQIISDALFLDGFNTENIFDPILLMIPFTIPFTIWSLILWIMACKQSLQLGTIDVIAVSILTMIIVGIIFVPISILLIGSPIQEGWFEI